MTVFGTRPEAIKLASLIGAFGNMPCVTHSICVTGQHRQMLDQVLELFNLVPDFDLAIMQPGQDLTHITTAALVRIGEVLERFQPDWIVVQGDTSTAFTGALAAFYRRVKVAHVEAGLRTGNIYSPWPEEMNRRLVSALATLHFPPTKLAASNLIAEGVLPGKVLVTGNTVIDALQIVIARLRDDLSLKYTIEQKLSFLHSGKKLILVTGHRRENLDGGLARVCHALLRLSEREDVEIVYPVHLNPRVQKVAQHILAGRANVHLIEPLDYLPFVALMQRAELIVTDSGGIQEEAPGLGKPVLVTRDTTERPEAIAAGTARLVGADETALVAAVTELLDNPGAYAAMSEATNPFGDGRASGRIVRRILDEGP